MRWPLRPEGYEGSVFLGEPLRRIWGALTAYRGFQDLVSPRGRLAADFYVMDSDDGRPLIVERDEEQHFTRPRELTFASYPPAAPLGFNLETWARRCAEKHKSDPDKRTPWRDEQRAWYDSLRDLVAPEKGFRPTVRLYAGEVRWCELNPLDAADMACFVTALGEVDQRPTHESRE